MNSGGFPSAREAKEFLVSRIVEEAQRENICLSEIERKMLYFSETDWTLPDIMQVNEQFDRDYNQKDYENKVTKLIVTAAKHDRDKSRDAYDAWLEAIRILQKEDHYILVMTQAANLRPRGDALRLFIAGVSLAAVVLGYIVVSSYLSDEYGRTFGKYFPHGANRLFYYGIIGLFAFMAYRLGWITRW